MESIAIWFAEHLGSYVSPEITIFLVSMIPILELRGGLVVAAALQVPIVAAVPICIIGNIIPIPFILLFIKQIFKLLKKVPGICKIIFWLEKKAMGKSENMKNIEFWGLALFVGIPLPGTGAWTGALIAALREIDIKKASLSILLGVLIATVIVATLSYGLFGMLS